jgi:hypothetical protein
MEKTIPRKDFDFDIVQEKISSTAILNSILWKLNGEWLNNELLPKKNEWEKAWKAYQNPLTRTVLITFTKTEKRVLYEKPLRLLVRNLQSNTLVMPEDLYNMGIAVLSSGRKLSPIPTSYPSCNINSSVIRILTVYFRDRDSLSLAKPKGVRGAAIRWCILNEPPTDISLLTNSSFASRSPFTLKFEESQRGKTVWFCLCWENTRGEQGPWGEIVSAVIP